MEKNKFSSGGADTQYDHLKCRRAKSKLSMTAHNTSILDSVPATESLADTYERVVRYWEHSIAPILHEKKKILIVAHGNSLRALVKYLDGISDEDITSLNIPTGIPLVYLLNDELKPIEHFYLADSNVLEQAVSEVKNQSSSDEK